MIYYEDFKNLKCIDFFKNFLIIFILISLFVIEYFFELPLLFFFIIKF